MALMLKWTLAKLVRTICDRLQNRFDCVIAIEGNRGLGKSTLAYKLCKLVKLEMKRRGLDAYKFHPRRDILYTRREVIKFFHSRQRSGIADEMINVTFSRDFYNEDQKDLIKMINMNRDHFNLFLACVPHFKNLDTQIKKLCSMRITVIRRGMAIIQTPNRTIYSKDIWDEQVNEKIERKWLEKKVARPHYSRLTTFRGFLKFPPLTAKQEKIYQKIKDDKRNIIAKDKGLVQEEEATPFDVIYNHLVEGKIKNMAMLEGMGLVNEIKPQTLKSKLRKKLSEDNKTSKITNWFYDDKAKEKIVKERKVSEITALIQEARGKIND